MNRYDFDAVDRFVTTHSISLPLRELEAYALWWYRRKSYRECAAELGVKEHAFRKIVARLRRRVRIAGDVHLLAELEETRD